MRTSVLLFLLVAIQVQAQQIQKKYLQNESVTYEECINFYKGLEKKYRQSKLVEFGKTDIGKPLHLFVISKDADFDFNSTNNKGKAVVLINNGIHAGEPCGVDACLGLSEDLLSTIDSQQLLDHVLLAIVPFYNIDGALNRSCCSRANQNGPIEYGFRANSRNLDLNRDFIKCDAQNTRSLIEIIQQVKPHLFIDTHISDGADYGYTMTLIATQHNKLNHHLGTYLNTSLLPQLYQEMDLKNNAICPYVDTKSEIPDSGIIGFLETPRFATGYAALFNIIGFVTEAHMLKPYPEQVKATYDMLQSFVSVVNKEYKTIIQLKAKADEEVSEEQHVFPLNWNLDTNKFTYLNFKGFEASYKKSTISGLPRLYYDRNKPFVKKVRYYNEYSAKDIIKKPKAYLIPQAWFEVIELLNLNQVLVQKINTDTVLHVTCYYVDAFKSPPQPYEGHFLHSGTVLRTESTTIKSYAGDYIVYCNQPVNRFIIETLEPKAVDSYFNWNFFDSALQQKEWFSDYVYEETAEKLLKENPDLKKAFDNHVQSNQLQNNHNAQLVWIYKHAPGFEKSAYRYPVFRIE